MRVALLCSYPPRHVTSQHFHGARSTHVSSWNVTLVEALSRVDGLELTVITNGPLFRSQVIRRGRITFILYGALPKIEWYLPQLKLWRTRRILQQLQPDLVHGVGNEHMYPWIALHSGFPHIVTYHGILFERWQQPALWQRIRLRLEAEVFQNARNVILISPSVEKLVYGDRPAGSSRRFLIPNAVAREFFAYRDAQRDLDLAMVGMIYPVKNTHLIIPIVEQLRAAGLDVKARIIGGPVHSHRAYADGIRRDIDARGLAGAIELCGQVENRLMPEALGRCRILLHLSDFETSPMVIREAMALGVVPVAKPVGGIPDMIEDGVNGILLKAADPVAEATHQISALLDRPAELDRLSQAARNGVREVCDPDLIAARHFEAYRQVVSC